MLRHGIFTDEKVAAPLQRQVCFIFSRWVGGDYEFMELAKVAYCKLAAIEMAKVTLTGEHLGRVGASGATKPSVSFTMTTSL
jgi:hypothetical protein